MICESLIREALSPDPLEQAKAKVQTRRIKAITDQRYEEMHKGALRRLRVSVPTAPGCNGGSSPEASA